MSAARRIVLFGIHGQVGSRLLTTLTVAGYEVTGIDRARCDFAQATPKEIALILRAVEPQLVINAAAYTAVDAAEKEEAAAMRINAEMPEMLAVAAHDQGVKLVHFSTDYVFDGVAGAPYGEDVATRPLGVYARSKRDGEVAVRAQGGHVFRLQWVYGGRGRNFFTTMAALLTTRDEVRVVADQLGAPSHAQHIAEAITGAAPRLIGGEIPAAIYHLSAAGSTSWHGFACAIARALQSRARVVPIVSSEYPLPAPRPKDVRLDGGALASYGIRMPHWHEGIPLAMKEIYADS